MCQLPHTQRHTCAHVLAQTSLWSLRFPPPWEPWTLCLGCTGRETDSGAVCARVQTWPRSLRCPPPLGRCPLWRSRTSWTACGSCSERGGPARAGCVHDVRGCGRVVVCCKPGVPPRAGWVSTLRHVGGLVGCGMACSGPAVFVLSKEAGWKSCGKGPTCSTPSHF